MVRDLNFLLDGLPEKGWRPGIYAVAAYRNLGIEQLYDAIQKHKNYLLQSGQWMEKRYRRREVTCISLVEDRIKRYIQRRIEEVKGFNNLMEKVKRGELDPYTGADQLTKKLIGVIANENFMQEGKDQNE
ncbi:hypothetical protein A6M21_15735 [Desulfotomaculum copahuensis]|uniref:Uncharacterized protein n=1 Tax=Desulfotomaculum copahuensis TaxID=1838280 RepID=A0A1B7LB00_9FIRM|nr:hypothetical protein A6M21_15735 [Desulfotomaculum copahuensis]